MSWQQQKRCDLLSRPVSLCVLARLSNPYHVASHAVPSYLWDHVRLTSSHEKCLKYVFQHLSLRRDLQVLHGVQADPHHGERWTQLRKRPENGHKRFEDLMRLLVRDLTVRPDHEL
jgi:hypothetical protein